MMNIEQGAPLRGLLSKDQIALIVNLCDMAGKMQGVSSYRALGDLLGALEAFAPIETEKDNDDG